MSLYLLRLDLWGKDVWLVGGPHGVHGVEFVQPRGNFSDLLPEPSWAVKARRQWEDFRKGRRKKFTLPLERRKKSPFGEAVMGRVGEIPPGTCRTYGEIARLCGSPAAARAVGRLMARNPFPVLIPCHRVIGANGKLTGYSGPGGVGLKKWLLDKELEVFGTD